MTSIQNITMSVRHLILLLKTSLQGPVKPQLGRWNIDSHRQTMLKIKYANEDNCGTCGEYDSETADQLKPTNGSKPQLVEKEHNFARHTR